ncbi:MAG TPA: peptidoglycan DD-metalloendopeptidase family protein [Rhizomicrobium sp.]|nr:peptidoglycan DD-metalloendopeptidase family protein [Rhizomicrobium sp.]
MRRESAALFLLLLAAPALANSGAKSGAKETKRVDVIVPTPRPVPAGAPVEPAMDLSHALPGKALASLPSSAQQLKSLSSELKQGQPELKSAKEKSDALAAQTAALRRKLIATAARIESLERRKAEADAEIRRLMAEDSRLSAGFANDRVAVTKLLGVLERLQHDMPPALAMRPDDALSAARGSMLIGASLPPVYAQAARLSRRIDALKRTRQALEQQQAQAADTAARLTTARGELDELLAQKEKEAAAAAQNYGTLKNQMETIARQAADFEALLVRVKALRQKADHGGEGTPGQAPGVVTVTAQNSGNLGALGRNALLEPVVGALENGSAGLSYATQPGAQVIAPADGKVLYAGPYHKNGQVLILEITTGYDVVLAGLGRVTVKPNDQLLAGEPVGTMPPDPVDDRLYFEVRHGGRGLSPAPWLKLNTRPQVGKANGT